MKAQVGNFYLQPVSNEPGYAFMAGDHGPYLIVASKDRSQEEDSQC
ncbi:MAG: hypothetical protein RMK30_10535 [Anaerolineae bacterium]|nr:hypothetical protein [Anaerolineae bacterium]